MSHERLSWRKFRDFTFLELGFGNLAFVNWKGGNSIWKCNWATFDIEFGCGFTLLANTNIQSCLES